MRKPTRPLGWVLLLGWMLSVPVQAGVVRHDLDDFYYRDFGQSDPFDPVGRITGRSVTGGGFSASGVLFDDRWLLTAAHVVDDAAALSFSLQGQTYQATDWLPHAHWSGGLWDGYDIALVKLNRAVTGVPAATRDRSVGDDLGQLGFTIGYGTTGTGLTGATVNTTQLRGGINTVDRISGRILLSDFDQDGVRHTGAFLGSTAGQTLEYNVAPGDSGGALFTRSGNEIVVTGITSFLAAYDGLADGDYGDWSGYTEVAPFNDWIDAVLRLDAGDGFAFLPYAYSPSRLPGAAATSNGSSFDGLADLPGLDLSGLAIRTALGPASIPTPGTLAMMLALAGLMTRRDRAGSTSA